MPTKSKSTMKWKANSDDETEKSHLKHLSSQIPIPKPSVISPKRKAVSDDENDVDKPKPKHMSPQIIVTEVSSASNKRTASFTDGGGMEKAKEKHVSSKLLVPSSYPTSMKQKTSADNRSDPEKSKQKCVNRGLPIHRKEDVNVKDIGLHYEDIEKLSHNEIYDLMLHHWKPGKDFSFPRTTEASGEKHFLIKHLDAFSWLAYSQYLDGCFCIPCLLFGRKTGHRVAARLKKLFTEPYTYWASACSRFKDHEQRSAVHIVSVLIMENFRQRMEHQQRSVTEAANKVVREGINSNRAKIKSIVKTVVLCGQQNLALTGHRDDAKHYDDPLNNPGNFQVLLNFRIDSGDKVLENHFKTCPKNATYRSKTIQNKLLGCCGEQIIEHIINEVKEAKFFSVLADEVSDVSSKEQMSMVLRYVDKAGHIREAFVGFVECDQGTSGQAVCDGIKKTLRNFGLDLNNCRGQGYDGAGNMAGRYIGAAKLFQNDYPQASYVHCKAHRLNLCVCEAC